MNVQYYESSNYSRWITDDREETVSSTPAPFERVSTEILARLTRVGTQTAAGILHKLGYRNCFMIGVHPLAVQPGQVMVGQAVTLRFIPLREDLVKAQYDSLTGSPHRTALESVGPGDVLVVDANGSLEAAVAGDMFTRRIQYRGASGVVIHGCVRDLSKIKTIGLPVFASGIHGAGIPRTLMSAGFNEWIQCGGCPVTPGDVILGDEDGVVVVPPSVVEAVVEEGLEHEQEEEFIRLKLAAGATLHTAYPMDEATRAEYREWLKMRER